MSAAAVAHRRTIDTWAELTGKIDAAIAAIQPAEVRRYFRGVQRFEELYRREFRDGIQLPPRVRDYVMKKFPRHREFPEALWDEVNKTIADELAAANAKVDKADEKTGPSKTAVKKQKKCVEIMADFQKSRRDQAAAMEE